MTTTAHEAEREAAEAELMLLRAAGVPDLELFEFVRSHQLTPRWQCREHGMVYSTSPRDCCIGDVWLCFGSWAVAAARNGKLAGWHWYLLAPKDPTGIGMGSPVSFVTSRAAAIAAAERAFNKWFATS